MPNYLPIEWTSQNLKGSIRPTGIRGWGIFRTIPYRTGNILSLALHFDKTKADEQKFHYTGVLLRRFPSGQEQSSQLCSESFTSSPHNKVKCLFGTALIIDPGHYSVMLTLGTESAKVPYRQTVVIFDAFANDIWRTDIALKILIGVIGGIIGSIGMWLITALGNSGK